jgi:hypothetical protein
LLAVGFPGPSRTLSVPDTVRLVAECVIDRCEREPATVLLGTYGRANDRFESRSAGRDVGPVRSGSPMRRQVPSAGQIDRLRKTVQRLDPAVRGARFDGAPLDSTLTARLTVDALLAELAILEFDLRTDGGTPGRTESYAMRTLEQPAPKGGSHRQLSVPLA